MNGTDRQTTDDRQTDGRAIAYSEREHEFTFAKKLQFIHIVNGDRSETATLSAAEEGVDSLDVRLSVPSFVPSSRRFLDQPASGRKAVVSAIPKQCEPDFFRKKENAMRVFLSKHGVQKIY